MQEPETEQPGNLGRLDLCALELNAMDDVGVLLCGGGLCDSCERGAERVGPGPGGEADCVQRE
eukprot:955654-Pyramimonas_sp.AAC.1